jgi:hypothetical protein
MATTCAFVDCLADERKAEKMPRRGWLGEAFFYCCSPASVQQVFPSIAFSVQFATELTSLAAPCTVLQAAVPSAAAISAAVINFWTMESS